MTEFEKLAARVANNMMREAHEDGFETFADKKKCEMWDSNDIREEICYQVTVSGGDYFDDMSTIMIGNSVDFIEMPYKEFYALVRKNLK